MADFAANKKKSKPLTSKQVEKLFEMKSNEKSIFEKLPKNLIAMILGYLEEKNLAKIMRLNKFCLNLLSESNICSNQVWKNLCARQFEKIISNSFIYKIFFSLRFFHTLDENEIDLLISNLKKSEYEKKLNRYHLFFKYGIIPKWHPVNHGQHVHLSPDGKSFHTGKNFWKKKKKKNLKLIFHFFFRK